MNTRNVIISCVSALFLMQSAGTAMAGPNGKPFAEINGQIVEIQNDITSLKTELADFKDDVDTRFDTVEAKIGAIDLKVADLEAKDKLLAADIQAVLLTATGNTATIDQILTSIGTINTDIANLQADIAALETADSINLELIKVNEAAITQLEADVAVAYDQLAGEVVGLATLLTQKLDIHEFVTALNQYKIEVQEKFDRKQDIINATCADGEFISNLQADGSFVCNAPTPLANGITRTTHYSAWVYVPRAQYVRTGSYQQEYDCGTFGWSSCYRTVYTYGWRTSYANAYITCPTEHLRASMGRDVIWPAYASVSAHGAEGARAAAYNTNRTYSGKVRAFVTCFGFNP